MSISRDGNGPKGSKIFTKGKYNGILLKKALYFQAFQRIFPDFGKFGYILCFSTNRKFRRSISSFAGASSPPPGRPAAYRPRNLAAANEARHEETPPHRGQYKRRRSGIRLFSTILYIHEVCLMAALTGFRQNFTKIL
ncbi:MAG: hypothetical protein K2L38_03785 [Dysosmobacter sp.]|nr:hypothetical protein [Dysosmobacter sp.]